MVSTASEIGCASSVHEKTEDCSAVTNSYCPSVSTSPGAASSVSCGRHSSTTISSAKSRSCGGVSARSSWGADAVTWEKIGLAHRIWPYYCYAHCADDVRLLAVFIDLTELSDVDGDCVRLLLRTLKLLRRCDYFVEDICCIMAHASAYFQDVYEFCGGGMDEKEVGNTLATLMFIAHSYVQDETCPLRIWHKNLFRKYCPLETLSAAVVRLMEIRRYILRLEPKDLSRRYARLMAGTTCGGSVAKLALD